MLPSRADLRRFASGAARRAAVLAAGGLCLAIGGGFLLSALWLVTAERFGSVVASLAMAGLLMGAGLILLVLAPAPPTLPTPADRLRKAGAQGTAYRPSGHLPPLAEAFLFGLSVALQVRSQRR